MKTMPFRYYRPFAPIDLPNRTWPNKTITKAPTWGSVCLRDGNQALMEPMSVEKKCRMFQLLVDMGFKEIEVGFPTASDTELEFVRKLIDENMIPDDVSIQVLTQARPALIRGTFEAVRGAKRVILHVYNPTSELQRRVVYRLDKNGIKKIAVDAAKLVKELAASQPETHWTFQYSPESFTGTELDFALDVCNAVIAVWQPSPDHKAIINLPATVEMSTSNIYADMIEWVCWHIMCRDSIVISLHTHNDRGTGVAATEFGLMAGADRVEGTLFGNGERTGNVDIITLAGNMMTQGVDPCLDFSDITEIVRVYEECTGMTVDPRHPYAGKLAHTAFSGGHQDAINKGLRALRVANSPYFEVPYLTTNPTHIGKSLKEIVRLNSQSGKGGTRHVMEEEHGVTLPPDLLLDFSAAIQKVAVATGKEVVADDVWRIFRTEYLDRKVPYELVEHYELPTKGGREITATINVHGTTEVIVGVGKGPVDALASAMRERFGIEMTVLGLEERAIKGKSGSDIPAIAFVPIRFPGREPVWGVGMDADTTTANLAAVISAVNRSLANVPTI